MFDWDDGNLDHIVRHGVNSIEAEGALLDPRRIGSSAYNVGTETRWGVLGATENGRILVVVFTRRGQLIRVVTARDATVVERRRYWR